MLLNSEKDLIRGARVGAVVHPASVLPDLRHTADVLLSMQKDCHLSRFSARSMAPGARSRTTWSNRNSIGIRIPAFRFTACMAKPGGPQRKCWQDIDVLLFDLQDVGTRVYTFIHTMAYCMEACALLGKQ